jgi:hypothetical protein
MTTTNTTYSMKEKLFKQAFKKAEQQCGKTSKNGISTHLENVFTMELNFQTSKMTFSRYYEQFVEESSDRIMNPSTDLLNKLAEYIGCTSYEDFVTRIKLPPKPPKTSKGITFLERYKWIILFVLLTIIVVVLLLQLNKQRWMIWDKTHYVEVAFDLKKYDVGQLKLYNEERINDFRKIEVDYQTQYKNPDETPRVWYGKNYKKELEYFTSYGMHPETGKYLKPLSDHMFNKHVCPE